MIVARCAATIVAFTVFAAASPAATRLAQPASMLDYPAPSITPAPTKTLQARADTLDKLGSQVNSVLSSLGSAIPSYVTEGIPNYFQNIPGPDEIKSRLGINDTQLAVLPYQVLNLSPYANWTEQGWNVRFHGNVYKQPEPSLEKLNELANIFVPGDLNSLSESEQAQARNVTQGIYVIQQKDVQVRMRLEPAPGPQANEGGGGNTAPGGSQNVTLPYNTTSQGDFDVFVPIDGSGLIAGNQTKSLQKLNVYASVISQNSVTDATLGNATAYLVPPTGFTVISDIDDILRITKIYQPKQGLLNSFARPYVPWENMPDIYYGWAQKYPDMHFHYLTTTPEQVTRNYMDFIFKTYPLGSFDTRPLNFSDISATLAIRMFLLEKIFQTFPQRKFILVADTSNSDVMKDYPTLAKQYPGQVQCIFLRNTSATDDDKFPYNTKQFKGLNQSQYMFFLHPNDLTNIDIEGGNCWNSSIKQNVTFGIQDELLGIHGSAASSIGIRSWALLGTLFSALFFLLP